MLMQETGANVEDSLNLVTAREDKLMHQLLEISQDKLAASVTLCVGALYEVLKPGMCQSVMWERVRYARDTARS